MTKQLVGGLVAGFLLMVWQTLSHTALNLHAVQEKYTPNNAAIMEALNQNLPEEGMYFLPGMPPGSTMEDYEKMQATWDGKPWAQINYNKSFNTSMGANIFRGLMTNLVIGLVLIWLLGKIQKPGFMTILFASLAVGFMAFCFHPYPGFIWYETSGIWIELLDSLAAFGLAGIWLGWWMNRKAYK